MQVALNNSISTEALSMWVQGWLSSEDSFHDTIQLKKVYMTINDDNPYDAIIFSQIMYWHGNSKETGKTRLKVYRDGYHWLAKEHADWYGECGIKERQARASIDRIANRGLIIKEYYRFNGLRTLHVRIDWEVFFHAVRQSMSPRSDELCHPAMTQNVRPLTETTTVSTNSSSTKPTKSVAKKKNSASRVVADSAPAPSAVKVEKDEPISPDKSTLVAEIKSLTGETVLPRNLTAMVRQSSTEQLARVVGALRRKLEDGEISNPIAYLIGIFKAVLHGEKDKVQLDSTKGDKYGLASLVGTRMPNVCDWVGKIGFDVDWDRYDSRSDDENGLVRSYHCCNSQTKESITIAIRDFDMMVLKCNLIG